MLHFEGLRKKVIKNYFIIIIIMVTLFEGLFMFYIQNYYYDSVKQLLESEIKYADEYNAITMETTSFEKKVKNIFDKQPLTKNSEFGISIIDKDKNIILDQYGFKSKEKANYEDVNNALKDIKTKNLTPYTYRIPDTGEHVMSISLPLKVNNIIEGVVRYTVSLDAIDNAILKQATWLILAGIFILIIAILISLKFAET
ncbi:TPA: cell wall metabolism sensor histidine kinase WalK, partial [Clostridioides difficile]